MAPPEVKTRNAIKGHNLDELSLEDIQHYVTSLSQYHKIFLHRTLAHWRNSTGTRPCHLCAFFCLNIEPTPASPLEVLAQAVLSY